jgi:CRISPR-associated protein Cmr2
MSSKSVFEKKLSAFMHDPIDKPFILMQGGSHEERAKHIADLLQVSIEKEEGADWIASAMERVLLPQKSSMEKNLQIKFLDNPEIKHPLSGKGIDCADLKKTSVEEIKTIVNKSTVDFVNPDPEIQHLLLWRNYIEILKQNSPTYLKRFWSIIPADTRIPDHSIFEHLKLTSACYNAMADKENKTLLHNLSFLLVTIGPVQKFIATARKLQDLWMGSFILSYLIWSGMKIVIDQYGPDSIIFPDLHKQPLVDYWLKNEKGINPIGYNEKYLFLPSLPNRFLALIPNDSVNELGKSIEAGIKQTFISKGFESLHNLKGGSKGRLSMTIDPTLFEAQLNHFLNVYWVAVPWPQSKNGKVDWQVALDNLSEYFSKEESEHYEKMLKFFSAKGEYPPNIGTAYGLIYSFTEKALGARKSIRIFLQTTEEGQKCSLCGERRAYKKECNSIREYKKGLIAEKEYLCGVCLTKRLGKYAFADIFSEDLEIEFPSIAEVAVSDLKLNLLQNRPEGFKHYIQLCRDLFGKETAHYIDPLPMVKAKTGFIGNIGGEFFIEDFLTEKNLKSALEEEQFQADEEQDLRELREELKKLLSVAFKPTPYYAVIMLDGDNMGKWLKGEFAPPIEQVFHSQVWKNLPEAYKNDLNNVCHEGKRPISPAIHGAISTSLRDYSLTLVRRIIEEDHLGKLIYAGGDDVLALVNLRDLLPVIKKLRAAFSGHINGDIEPDFTKKEVSGFVQIKDDMHMTMGPRASASMGIVIAHYRMPFSLVMDKAREMEKSLAKKEKDKDAFAIALMKHSGEISEGVAKWRYEDNKYPGGTVDLLEKLADWIRRDLISNKFIYSLHNEFSRLSDNSGRVNINSKIIETEIARLIKRSKNKNTHFDDKELLEFINDLNDLFHKLEGSLKYFMALLQTANFLAREVRAL